MFIMGLRLLGCLWCVVQGIELVPPRFQVPLYRDILLFASSAVQALYLYEITVLRSQQRELDCPSNRVGFPKWINKQIQQGLRRPRAAQKLT